MYQPDKLQPLSKVEPCLLPREVPREGCRCEPLAPAGMVKGSGWKTTVTTTVCMRVRQLLIGWPRTSKVLNNGMIEYTAELVRRIEKVKLDVERRLKNFKLHSW